MEKQSGEVFSEELLEDIRLEIEERKGDHLLELYRETHPHLVMHGETPPAQLGFNVTAMEVDGQFFPFFSNIKAKNPNPCCSVWSLKRSFSQLARCHSCLPHSLEQVA
jgi:hypothetical protein